MATSHESLAERYLLFPQVLEFVKGDFENKMLFKNYLRASFKLDTLDALMQVSSCMIGLEM